MPLFHQISLAMLAAVLALAAAPARADGLADLKAALSRASGIKPVAGVVTVRTFHRAGDGDDAFDSRGTAEVNVEDGPRGLHLHYSSGMLERIGAEQSARARDSNSKAPTLSALQQFNMTDMLPMLSAAPRLTRMLERATFRDERSDTYGGKPARVLSFSIPIETLSERERKYAKRFDSVLQIWIGADGTPMASRLKQTVYGRIFIVVSFESNHQEECVFAMTGDRLVTVRSERSDSASGAGEKDARNIVKTLQLR